MHFSVFSVAWRCLLTRTGPERVVVGRHPNEQAHKKPLEVCCFLSLFLANSCYLDLSARREAAGRVRLARSLMLCVAAASLGLAEARGSSLRTGTSVWGACADAPRRMAVPRWRVLAPPLLRRRPLDCGPSGTRQTEISSRKRQFQSHSRARVHLQTANWRQARECSSGRPALVLVVYSRRGLAYADVAANSSFARPERERERGSLSELVIFLARIGARDCPFASLSLCLQVWPGLARSGQRWTGGTRHRLRPGRKQSNGPK